MASHPSPDNGNLDRDLWHTSLRSSLHDHHLCTPESVASWNVNVVHAIDAHPNLTFYRHDVCISTKLCIYCSWSWDEFKDDGGMQKPSSGGREYKKK